MKPGFLTHTIFFIMFVALLLQIASCKKSSTAEPEQEPSVPVEPVLPVYKLVWSDEFDSTAVNTANWNFETGGNGWGNNEKQWYQESNATVSGGHLTITAKKEQVNN